MPIMKIYMQIFEFGIKYNVEYHLSVISAQSHEVVLRNGEKSASHSRRLNGIMIALSLLVLVLR